MSADKTKGVWALISLNFQEILSKTWSFILIFVYINFEFLGHKTFDSDSKNICGILNKIFFCWWNFTYVCLFLLSFKGQVDNFSD